jgi:LemA protein
MITAIVLAAIVLILVIWLVATYNKLVRLRVSAEEGSSEIEVQLKRRHDLIPNLVETVKGYATHEKGVFEEVTEARTSAQSAQGMEAQGQAEGALSQALGRLFAVAEAYPDLKASENFLSLQSELTATEDRISAARRFYNSTVKALNAACQTIPSKFVAPIAKVEEREFFEIDDPAEREVVEVSFS